MADNLHLKQDELRLAFEYQVKKQEEKEEKYATDAQETERLDTDETETAALTQEDAKEESTGRDITVGEFLEIRKSSGESAQEQLMQELLAEMDSPSSLQWKRLVRKMLCLH